MIAVLLGRLRIKFPFLFLFAFLCYVSTHAQRQVSDYIVRDTTYSSGSVLRLGKNRIEYRKIKHGTAFVYTAREVKEYASGGNVYESFMVDGEPKFVKNIVAGRASLYRDGKRFALKVDSNVFWIHKRNFRTVLGEALPCEGMDSRRVRVSYSRPSLNNYVKQFNEYRCQSDGLPFRRIGGNVGYAFLNFNAVFGGSLTASDRVAVPTLSVGADLPFFRPRSLFLATELNWFYARPLFYNEDEFTSLYAGLNVNAVSLQADVKLFLSDITGGYLKAGVSCSWVNVASPTGLVQTSSFGSVVEVSQRKITGIGGIMYGFNAAAGTDIPFRRGKNINVELRYSKTFEGKFDFLSLSYSGISVLAGINI